MQVVLHCIRQWTYLKDTLNWRCAAKTIFIGCVSLTAKYESWNALGWWTCTLEICLRPFLTWSSPFPSSHRGGGRAHRLIGPSIHVHASHVTHFSWFFLPGGVLYICFSSTLCYAYRFIYILYICMHYSTIQYIHAYIGSILLVYFSDFFQIPHHRWRDRWIGATPS